MRAFGTASAIYIHNKHTIFILIFVKGHVSRREERRKLTWISAFSAIRNLIAASAISQSQQLLSFIYLYSSEFMSFNNFYLYRNIIKSLPIGIICWSQLFTRRTAKLCEKQSTNATGWRILIPSALSVQIIASMMVFSRFKLRILCIRIILNIITIICKRPYHMPYLIMNCAPIIC